jgi:hypothetical protein
MLTYFQATQAADAKRSALHWLATQLRWERRLSALRDEERRDERASGRAA